MAESTKTKKPPHVLIFPFPSLTHINPMIQFAKRLNSKGVKTTLAATTYISNSIPSGHRDTAIAIEEVSDGFDDGGFESANSSESYLQTFHDVGSKSLARLIKKLTGEGNAIDAIIYDAFVNWALDVAMEFGIDGGAFFTQACSVNSIYYHAYKELISVPLKSTISVPGLPELEYSETPSFVYKYGPDYYPGWSKIVLFDQFANLDQARWVFSNSFYKLEQEVIEWMNTVWRLKVIGPTLPSMYLDKRLEDDKDYGISLVKPNHGECMNWLNGKPKGSVVYVSFGSLAQLGPEQMEEVAWGLNDSNANYLWIVRGSEEEKLPKGFVDVKTKKGLIIAWCKQLEVLTHESIGCFVTHCGFNSTLEAISLGVPIIGMPQWTDQTTNAKCLEDIWGVGVRAKTDEKGIVRRENLTSCIKEIMEGDRGEMARNNGTKWSDLAREAVSEGGSSDKDINEFVSELKHAC